LSSVAAWGAAREASAEVMPAPGEGGCVTCLGVVDQLLARCKGELKGCVASQDDRPEVFEAPWQLPDLSEPDVPTYMGQLKAAVANAGGRIYKVGEDGRYLRAEFSVNLPFVGPDIDDCEWYFTPGDTLVQFRAERRSGGSDFGENRRRLEALRKDLDWDNVPVLRNRQRALFFFESPFDSFGPALYDALSPGQEPSLDEAAVLSKQGKSPEKEAAWAVRDLLSNDDLGVENKDGVLDAATREFLRATCDPKLQICD